MRGYYDMRYAAYDMLLYTICNLPYAIKYLTQLAALETDDTDAEEIRAVFGSLEKKIVRRAIVEGQPRIDGRDAEPRRTFREP